MSSSTITIPNEALAILIWSASSPPPTTFASIRVLNAAIDAEPTELAETDPSFEEEFLSRCFPRLEAKERSELTEMLETEYLHLLPMIEFNNMADQPVAERKV